MPLTLPSAQTDPLQRKNRSSVDAGQRAALLARQLGLVGLLKRPVTAGRAMQQRVVLIQSSLSGRSRASIQDMNSANAARDCMTANGLRTPQPWRLSTIGRARRGEGSWRGFLNIQNGGLSAPDSPAPITMAGNGQSRSGRSRNQRSRMLPFVTNPESVPPGAAGEPQAARATRQSDEQRKSQRSGEIPGLVADPPSRAHRPGTMMWAALVPAAMIYAPPALRLSGKPMDSVVAPGTAMVV